MYEFSDEVKKVGIVAVLYSTPGMGKTTLAALACKAMDGIFCPIVEDGLSPLQQGGNDIDLTGVKKLPTPIKTWEEFLGLLAHIGKNKPAKLVVFDSLNLLMASVEDYCFNRYYVENPDNAKKDEKTLRNLAYGFGKNGLISFMGNEWDRFVKFLRWAKENNINVLITSHNAITKVKLPNEELEYDMYSMDFPFTKSVNLGNMLVKEADYILFGERDLSLIQSAGTKKVRAIDNGRVIRTIDNPRHIAKKRGGIDETVGFEWDEVKRIFGL